MTVSFETPFWLITYYHVIGTLSLFLCTGTIWLVIFKSEKIDNFRHVLLVFQLSCTITDIHLSFLMQPLPLFPVMAGYSVGYLAKYCDIWTHYLIAFIVSAIVAQLESLTFCFVKKHQTIAKITKQHVVPPNVHNFIAVCLPFAPLVFFLSFCEAGMRRDDQMEYVKKNLPEYLPGFSTLPNFAIYQLNYWFLFVIFMALCGGLVCALVFSLSTYDMFRMLQKVRRKISLCNFRRHRSTVKSLLAQFAASSLLLLPLFCFVIVIMLDLKHAQVITQTTLVVFSLRSSVNAIVLVFTTPPFRNFVLRKKSNQSVFMATRGISITRSSFQ